MEDKTIKINLVLNNDEEYGVPVHIGTSSYELKEMISTKSLFGYKINASEMGNITCEGETIKYLDQQHNHKTFRIYLRNDKPVINIKNIKQVYIYSRMSLKSKKDNHNAHISKMLIFCKTNKIDVVNIYQEEGSSLNYISCLSKRDEVVGLSLSNNIPIMVTKFDRFSRNLEWSKFIVHKGIQLLILYFEEKDIQHTHENYLKYAELAEIDGEVNSDRLFQHNNYKPSKVSDKTKLNKDVASILF